MIVAGPWLALGWTSALGAAPPADRLRPVLVSTDTPEGYASWRAARSLAPDPLACETVWAGTNLLCFRLWEGQKRRFVLASDLAAWQVPITDLHTSVGRHAAEHVARAELVPIEGTEASWLRLLDGDGWAAAGLFRPDLVADRLGGLPVRVAVPVEGALVAWRAQGEEIDRIMAVGVREIFEKGPAEVSPRIWSWDGKMWLPYGEAVPAKP